MVPFTSKLNSNGGFLGTEIPNELGLFLTIGAGLVISVTVCVLFKRKRSNEQK
jgi:hypothetical protein